MTETQTVAEFATKHGITIADWTTHGFHADEDGWEHQRWTFILAHEGRTLTVPFRTGTGWDREPSITDILDAIASDAHAGADLDFEEFCSNFGYDADSRKAYATWEACVKMRDDLTAFLGSDLLDELLYDTERA